MSEKFATVTVDVPQKSSGGVIHQRPINFEVFRTAGHYSLKPCLSLYERQVMNLPEELNFVMENGKPVSLRGKMDGNFHVIWDAVEVLMKDYQLH